MRWFWIDRFLEFERGRRAVTVKCVAMDEEHIDGYAPGHPMMSGALIIEGFAQTGGLLVGEYGGFTKRVVLAKVVKARFHFYPQPGDRMIYTVVLNDFNEQGAYVNAQSHIDGQLQCEAELMFAHVPKVPGIPDDMFEPSDLLAMIRAWALYDVGVDEEGNRIEPPQHLLEAERRDHAEFVR